MLRALVLSLACGAAIGARSGLVGRPRFTPRPASVAQRTREAARPTPLSVAAPRARCAARAAVGAASEQVGELASSLMAEVVEVNRARIRLEGLNAYAVIAALIMNSALRIFTTTCVPGARVDSSLERAISILVLLASTVSILAGSYTTVVFTLVGLYAKTALGRQMDAAYIEFFARTVCYRQTGFKTFIVCLASFSASLCLDLLLKLRGRWRWVAFGVASIATCLMLRSWFEIVGIGYALVFSARRV